MYIVYSDIVNFLWHLKLSNTLFLLVPQCIWLNILTLDLKSQSINKALQLKGIWFMCIVFIYTQIIQVGFLNNQ